MIFDLVAVESAPTVNAYASVKSTTMESTAASTKATAARPAKAVRADPHPRSGMEATAHGARPSINAVLVVAAFDIVRISAPIVVVIAEVMTDRTKSSAKSVTVERRLPNKPG